jgi:hypothetical protein
VTFSHSSLATDGLLRPFSGSYSTIVVTPSAANLAQYGIFSTPIHNYTLVGIVASD